jgi:DNA-binding MarR family transcriptional regulator
MSEKEEDIYQQTTDRFWETFPPVWNAVRSHVRSIATQQFDITVEQFHILRYIRRKSKSISTLAAIGRISRPAISQGVDALVHKGLINRQQSQEDRRFVNLELTKEGNALLDSIFAQNRKWMKTRLSSLGSEELQAISLGLGILKKAFEEPGS